MSGLTERFPLRTRDTLLIDTPAARATSRTDGFFIWRGAARKLRGRVHGTGPNSNTAASLERRPLRPAQQAPGQLARVLAVEIGGHARDDRRPIPPALLEQPLAAGGQVPHDAGHVDGERIEVDDVDVRLHPGREHAAVAQA